MPSVDIGRLDKHYKPPISRLVRIDKDRFIDPESKTQRISRLTVLRNLWVQQTRQYFPAFMEYCFSDPRTQKPFKQQWFQDEWSHAWDTKQRVFIAASRDHGKTSQIIGRTIWELGRDPNLRIKIACASDGRAKERLFEINQNITYNPRVHEVFPGLKQHVDGEWSKHKIIVERTIRDKDASVEALGITSTATGGRADILIGDDAVDRRNALSFPALREQIKQAWLSDWTNLLEPDSKIWVICTLWHKDDLNHMLMANPVYHVLKYAIDDHFGAFWPEKWSEKALRERFREIGSIEFNRAFRNQAVDLESVMIDPRWIRFENLEKNDKFMSRLDHLIFMLAYDPAGAPTGKKDQDYFAKGAIAVDPDLGMVYVLEMESSRLSKKQQSNVVIRDTARYDPFRVFIERVGGESLDEWVLDDAPLLAKIVEPVFPKGSKAERLLAETPLMEAGNVVFSHYLDPDRESWDPARQSIKHELEDFPFAKHDDLVDCLSMLLHGAQRYFLGTWAAREKTIDLRVPGKETRLVEPQFLW